MSDTLERLLKAIDESGMTPEQFVEQAKEPTLTRRMILGGAGLATLLGFGVGTVAAADTTDGIISANKVQIETVAGPSDTTVINLADDRVDMSSTEWFNLAQYDGTPGSATTVGDCWYDLSAD
tara:strand:+ start:730 stop:1098 length:369 start_codon:yes stop_codon:yes gene_type:complete